MRDIMKAYGLTLGLATVSYGNEYVGIRVKRRGKGVLYEYTPKIDNWDGTVYLDGAEYEKMKDWL